MSGRLENAIAELGGEPLEGSGLRSETRTNRVKNMAYDPERGRPNEQSPPEIFQSLTSGRSYPFSEGLHADLSLAKAGVYAIWRGLECLYVAIAGPGLDLTIDHKHMSGIRDRLGSHRYGRRSGDQFGVYLCDKLVLPLLTSEPIKEIAEGELSMDAMTRVHIHQYLSYRFALVSNFAEAIAIETTFAGGSTTIWKPLFNPRKNAKRKKAWLSLSTPNPFPSALSIQELDGVADIRLLGLNL
jgi:hypothetical protein